MAGLQAFAIEWPEIDIYGSLTASMAQDRDTALKEDAGIGIEWQNFEGIFGIGITDSNTWEDPILRYGAECSFTIPGIELDCGIRIGTLKASGAISRLSSPALSAGTALHSSPEGSGGISATLPSFNSSESPLSVNADFSLGVGKGKIQLMGFANMEKEWAASLSCNCIPSWAKSFSASFTGGSFVHSRKAGTSWFYDRALYPEDNYLAFMGEVNLKAGIFSTSTSASCYEDPFGGMRLWLRTLNSFEFNKWSIHTGLFLCDSELITTSGSRPCVRTQFYINPELSLGPVKKRFRIGLLFYDSMKISTDALRIPYSIYTVRGDLSYSTPDFSFKSSAYWTLDELNEKSKFWANTSFSYRIALFRGGTSITAQVEDGTGTFSLDQSITLSNPFRLSVRGRISAEEKDCILKNIKAEGKMSSSFSLRNVRVNLSAGINSVLLKN